MNTLEFTLSDKATMEELKNKHTDLEPQKAEQAALAELLAIKRKAKERKTSWTAAELLTTEFPPIKWIIPNLVTSGLTVLAGAPKLGKSWMALSWALGVSYGSYVMGKIPVQKAGVLYLALEDTPRRLQDRLRKLNASSLDNLHFITEWNKKPADLSAYLQQHPEIKLVIIDTWGRFARVSDYNDYGENTNKGAELKRIADDLDVALVVIHHARKSGKNDAGTDFQDSVLGSTGLVGAADSTILLRRGRGNRQAELLATGRDITEQELVLTFDENCGWTVEGNKTEILEGETQQLIHDWLKDNGGNGPKAVFTGLKEEGYEGTLSTVKVIMSRMAGSGKLERINGIYSIPYINPETTINPVNHVNQQDDSTGQRFTEFTGFTPVSEVLTDKPIETPSPEPVPEKPPEPPDMPPGFGGRYDYLYTELVNRGLSHTEADRQALELVNREYRAAEPKLEIW
jgi:hypothetical protein